MDESRFRVVLTGELVPGFGREAVVNALAGVFDAPRGVVARLLEAGERPVDGLYGAREASALQRRIEHLGAIARVELVKVAGQPVAGPVGNLRLGRAYDLADTGQARCLACGHLQLAGDRCSRCGLPMPGHGRHEPGGTPNFAKPGNIPPSHSSPAPANPLHRPPRTPARDIHAATRRGLREDWIDQGGELPTERHHLNLFMGVDSADLADACVRMAQGRRTRPMLSWTSGAVFSPFLWAMYRKLYAWGIVIFLFEILLPVGLIIFGSKYGVPGLFLYLGLGLVIGSRVFWPAVLQYLYCRHARRTIAYMHGMSPTFAPDIDIATRGGTSRTSAFTGGVVAIVMSLLTWSVVDTLYANLIEPSLTFSPSTGFDLSADNDQRQAAGQTGAGQDGQSFSEDRWAVTQARLRALSLRIDTWLDGSGRTVNPARLTIADIASELSLKPESILDGWEGVINFRSDGRIYKLISAGPDGEYGNADDVDYRRIRKH